MFRTNGIIESSEWREQRLRFLRGLLTDPPPGADVEAIKAEIAELERSRPHLLRWLLRRPTRTE